MRKRDTEKVRRKNRRGPSGLNNDWPPLLESLLFYSQPIRFPPPFPAMGFNLPSVNWPGERLVLFSPREGSWTPQQSALGVRVDGTMGDSAVEKEASSVCGAEGRCLTAPTPEAGLASFTMVFCDIEVLALALGLHIVHLGLISRLRCNRPSNTSEVIGRSRRPGGLGLERAWGLKAGEVRGTHL